MEQIKVNELIEARENFASKASQRKDALITLLNAAGFREIVLLEDHETTVIRWSQEHGIQKVSSDNPMNAYECYQMMGRFPDWVEFSPARITAGRLPIFLKNIEKEINERLHTFAEAEKADSILFRIAHELTEEDNAKACDCTGCPAWGEFQDNARAYPCDGCKWADDEYSGDFDPFEDGAE